MAKRIKKSKRRLPELIKIKICGETEDGEFYPADFVISTVHPKRLLEMLDTRLIRPAFRSRINNNPQTASGFAVYLKFRPGTMPYMNTNYYGYGCGTPWGCEHYTRENWPKGFLYMHFCHDAHAEWAESGVILSYMNFADVERWRGTRPGHRGDSYEAFKREHAEREAIKMAVQIKYSSQDGRWLQEATSPSTDSIIDLSSPIKSNI